MMGFDYLQFELNREEVQKLISILELRKSKKKSEKKEGNRLFIKWEMEHIYPYETSQNMIYIVSNIRSPHYNHYYKSYSDSVLVIIDSTWSSDKFDVLYASG
jgi:hypothetical protein